MSTQGVGVYGINSKFASGSLVFYEKAVGRTATGDVLTIGTGAVTVGGTSQDVDFAWYGTGSVSFVLDAGSATMTVAGVSTSVTGSVDIDTGDVTIDTGYGLEVGSTTQLTISNGDGATNLIPEIQFLGVGAAFAGGATAIATFSTTNDRTVSPKLAFVKGAAATQVATTAVADNEVIGSIIGYGSDGTDFETPVAAIEIVVDDSGGPGASAIGGSLEFYTTADASSTLTKALTIDNAQHVIFVGDIVVDATTASTSATTGSIQTDGGLGVALAAYFGADVFCDNAGGPTLQNELASATNPTLIPNRADETTGIGWATAQLVGVVSGAAILTLAAASATFAQKIIQDDTTESTSTTTGSIQTDGGLGIVGDFYAGDDIFLTSGAVLNYNAGNLTVTHASGSLSIAGSTAGTTLNITSAAPTAANNGIYSLMTSSAAWTGSVAALRARNTVTATGAGGNCYGGWFNLLFSSGAPTGLGLSAGLYVEAGSNIATTGVSSVLMATLLGDADGAITNSPILTLADASTLKTNILLEVGFNAGGTTVGTASSGTTKLYRTSVTPATMNANCSEALRVMVNGNIRWIPLATSPD